MHVRNVFFCIFILYVLSNLYCYIANNHNNKNDKNHNNQYILLDVLLCNIAEYSYELCRILKSPLGESKYKP